MPRQSNFVLTIFLIISFCGSQIQLKATSNSIFKEEIENKVAIIKPNTSEFNQENFEFFKDKYKKELNQKLICQGGRVAVLFTAVMALQYFQTPEDKKFEFFSSAWSSMGGQFLTCALFLEAIKGYGDVISARFPIVSWFSSSKKNHDQYYELQEQYFKIKEFLPVSLIDSFDKYLQNIYDAREGAREEDYKRISKVVETMLKLPLKSKPFSAQNLKNNFISVVSSYPEAISEEIITFVENLVLNSEYPETQGLKRKTSLFLLGPPGVGKTTLVYAMAKAMDHPIFELSLTDVKSEDKLRGEGSWNVPLKIGLFAEALIKTGIKNPFILVDEADKFLNSDEYQAQMLRGTFLTILSDVTSYFYNQTFEANIDISEFIFIFTGNEPLNDIGFPRRLTTLKFESLSHDKKLAFARNTIQKACNLYNLKITQKIKKKTKKIVIYDHNPGVAVLEKVLIDYVQSLARNILFERAEKHYDIESAFKKLGSNEPIINKAEAGA
ncbi:MAG: AAA family ATPase [Janthinobacterium lividum]